MNPNETFLNNSLIFQTFAQNSPMFMNLFGISANYAGNISISSIFKRLEISKRINLMTLIKKNQKMMLERIETL